MEKVCILYWRCCLLLNSFFIRLLRVVCFVWWDQDWTAVWLVLFDTFFATLRSEKCIQGLHCHHPEELPTRLMKELHVVFITDQCPYSCPSLLPVGTRAARRHHSKSRPSPSSRSQGAHQAIFFTCKESMRPPPPGPLPCHGIHRTSPPPDRPQVCLTRHLLWMPSS
jgi:hypothetical protein